MLIPFGRGKTNTNPLFYPDRLPYRLSHDPERLERMQTEPRNVDLLVWNVFASLDSDPERDYLAGQLQPLAGERLRAPLSLSLWTGVHRGPLLRPSAAYRRWLEQDPGISDPAPFMGPVEVPVRLESAGVLALVDATLDWVPQGAHGRDRFAELVDAGAEHARAVGKQCVVVCLYQSGTRAAAEISGRMSDLRTEEGRARKLPWHAQPPPVEVRELSWQRMLRIWEHSREGLKLSRQPIKQFLEHAGQLGLR